MNPIDILYQRFFVRLDAYGSYRRNPSGKASAMCRKSAVTRKVLWRHLRGESVVGSFAISLENETKWLCFDFDVSKEAKEVFLQGDEGSLVQEKKSLALEVLSLVKKLDKVGIRCVWEDSVGGFHLWILFDQVVSSDLAFRLGKVLGGCREIFPKQAGIEANGFGNWMRLPGRYHSSNDWSQVWDGHSWLSLREEKGWKLFSERVNSSAEMEKWIRFFEEEKLPAVPSQGQSSFSGWKSQVIEKMIGQWRRFYEKEGISGVQEKEGWFRGFVPGVHKNATPGFCFRPENGYFYSFYNQEKGFPQDFLTKKGFSEEEAWKKLAEEAGVEILEKEEDSVDEEQMRVLERDGKTWVLIKGKERELCNFTMRVLCRIRNDENEVVWQLVLEQKGVKEELEIFGDELSLVNRFREKIAKRGPFLIGIPRFHNLLLRHVWENSRMLEKRKTKYLGRFPGKSLFIYSNALASPRGKEPLSSLIPPKSSMRLEVPSSLLPFWQGIVEQFYRAYGEQAWKIFGFIYGSVWVDELADSLGFFPLLMVNGQKGTGKSTLGMNILACFGAHREVRPFNFNSTIKAWYRLSEKYRSIPLILNEYQSSKYHNATLTQLFDREGYQRAQRSNDLETHCSVINSTFIVISTRNITGYEADAVQSRMISIDLDSEEEQEKRMQAIQEIKKQRRYLSSFACLALRANVDELWSQVQAEIDSHVEVAADQRLIDIYSLIKVCAENFYEALELKDKYPITNFTEEIEKQQRMTQSSNVGEIFLNLLAAMMEKGELNGSLARPENEGETIYFSLQDSFPYVVRLAKQLGEEIPDQKTVEKSLKILGVENVGVSRKLGIRKRTWKWNRNLTPCSS